MGQQIVAKSTTGYMRREQHLALLPQTESQTFTPTLGTSADLAIALLTHYSFDLSGYTAIELVDRWQKQFPDSWLHIAVVEALYQGRYKAISVQQILSLWQRRGQASFHFNMEFERLICSKYPESLTSIPTPSLPPTNKITHLQELRTENKATREDTNTLSPSPTLPNQQPNSLLPAANHPPIEQFTPETSDRSESFTSKLKAMSNNKLLP